ncbi:MAG TPA: hypothetical protein VJB08_03530 [Candidatus Nanoarchaeia archaeon]|nr:hypothetical protein [Candidatus Nanoarchaeia archaeon]
MLTARKTISFILGLILLVQGGLPLLNTLNLISFTLPALPELALWIVFVVGGIWLLVDASREALINKGLMRISLVVGIVLIALGIIPLLNHYRVIGFTLPGGIQIAVDAVLALGGLLLLGGAFKGVY